MNGSFSRNWAHDLSSTLDTLCYLSFYNMRNLLLDADDGVVKQSADNVVWLFNNIDLFLSSPISTSRNYAFLILLILQGSDRFFQAF